MNSTLERRTPWSVVVLAGLIILLVQVRLLAPWFDHEGGRAVLSWDIFGYYLYLPAQFIYHDLRHLAFLPKVMAEYGPSSGLYQAMPLQGGAPDVLVMKYTAGLAVLYLPFFWIGHWAAGWLGYPQDGFSAPYQAAVAFGGLLVVGLGLAILRRFLLRWFSDGVTAVTLALLVLGTNYLLYAAIYTPMAHSYLFTIYALLLWLTVRWHEAPNPGRALAMGLLIGLATLIRPTELIIVAIPLLWGVWSSGTAVDKARLLGRYWWHVGILGVSIVAAGSLQLFYWKWLTGHWLYYSYDQNERLQFAHPHLREVLFSFRKGWFVYTPLMLIAVLGIGWLAQSRLRMWLVPVLIYLILNVWCVAAWDTWWYAGSWGQRAMIQSYAVLSLPLAACLTWGQERRSRTFAIAGAVVLALLVQLNLFQSWQYMAGILHPEDMTKSFWKAIFFKAQPTQADYARLDVDVARPGAATAWEMHEVGKQTFDGLATESGGRPGSGLYQSIACSLDATHPYSPPLEVRIADTKAQTGNWLRAGGWVWSEWGAWGSRLVVEVRRGDQQLAWYGIRVQNNLSVNRAWNHIYADIPLPTDAQPSDLVRIFGWMPEGASPFLLDDLTLEVATRHR